MRRARPACPPLPPPPQCVSATTELTTYFSDDDWLADLNPTNPLGARGALAVAYAALVRALWAGSVDYAIPLEIKRIVERHAPQFSGYGQHDSQEFASFFLDLLLEDVCRVKVKPTVSEVVARGRSDAEIADESWHGYRARNDSKVADVFAGLFRSHVVCNICSRRSITFDPFTSVSAPIPAPSTVTPCTLLYVGADNAPPVVFRFFKRDAADPTGAQLAAWLVMRVAEHGAEAAAANYKAARAEHIAAAGQAYLFPALLAAPAPAPAQAAGASPLPAPHEILFACDVMKRAESGYHASVSVTNHAVVATV